MELLIDANVAIDFLTNREPFADHAQQVMTLCTKEGYRGLISAGETTTIFYVLKKQVGANNARSHLKVLLRYLDVIDVTKGDITKALISEMTDFEDAVLAYGAKRTKIDYIITRDLKDFTKSPIPALSPEKFIISQREDPI